MSELKRALDFLMKLDETPCPVCGCEVRGQGGYLQCECPAPLAEAVAVVKDAMIHGTGYMKDGRRVDPTRLRVVGYRYRLKDEDEWILTNIEGAMDYLNSPHHVTEPLLVESPDA